MMTPQELPILQGECYEITWGDYSIVGRARVVEIDTYNAKVDFIMPNYKHDGHWRGDNLYKCLWWSNSSRWHQLKDAKIKHLTTGATFILRGLLPRNTTMRDYYGEQFG